MWEGSGRSDNPDVSRSGNGRAFDGVSSIRGTAGGVLDHGGIGEASLEEIVCSGRYLGTYSTTVPEMHQGSRVGPDEYTTAFM